MRQVDLLDFNKDAGDVSWWPPRLVEVVKTGVAFTCRARLVRGHLAR